MNRTPEPHAVLTIADISDEDLPNGSATVLTVFDQFGHPVGTALIDDAGYIRSVGDGKYYTKEHEVKPRETA